MRSRILKKRELAHLIRSGVAQFGVYETASKIGCVIRVTQEELRGQVRILPAMSNEK